MSSTARNPEPPIVNADFFRDLERERTGALVAQDMERAERPHAPEYNLVTRGASPLSAPHTSQQWRLVNCAMFAGSTSTSKSGYRPTWPSFATSGSVNEPIEIGVGEAANNGNAPTSSGVNIDRDTSAIVLTGLVEANAPKPADTHFDKGADLGRQQPRVRIDDLDRQRLHLELF